ncbi:MAG: hypothetical protein BHW40_11300 [Firmicutes bacterium CAG:65_45_313]|nr:MAG: hypothetical protein BHW40_11300 [Firmicutes bacterium CAG:65_45_313]
MQEYEELYNIAQELNTTQHSVDTESAVAAAYQLKRLIENPCGKRGGVTWQLMQKQYNRLKEKGVASCDTYIKQACMTAADNAVKTAKRIYAEEIYTKTVTGENINAEMLTIKLYAAVETFTNCVRDYMFELEKDTVTPGGNIRNSLAHLRARFADYPDLAKKLRYISKNMLPSVKEDEHIDYENLLDVMYTENQTNSVLQYQSRKDKICDEGRDVLRMLLLELEGAEIEDCGDLLESAVCYLQGRTDQLSYLERLLSDCIDGDIQLQELEYPEMIYYGSEVARKIEPLYGKPTEIADMHPIDDVRIVKGKHTERDLISGKAVIKPAVRCEFDKDNNVIAMITQYQDLYREGIGIDYTQLSFAVESIDVDVLESALVNKAKPRERELLPMLPWIECISTTDSYAFPIFSEVKNLDESFKQNHKWKQVNIQLSPYSTLKFKQNNIKKMQQDENNPPISYLMEIKVIPRIWQLGNWENYTVEEYEERVRDVICKVRDYFGIQIKTESVVFQTIEINNTFAFGHTMNELVRPLKYYQLYLKNFNECVYEVGKGRNKLVAALDREVSNKELNHRNRESMLVTGLYSSLKNTQNMIIKIYDKAVETQETLHMHNKKLAMDIMEPQGNGCYVRVEFRIKKEQKIHEAFKEGLSEETLLHPYHACPMEITQDDLVRIFQGLIEKYFEKPFEKYCEDSIRKIERLVENVNKEEEDWKIKFVNAVRDEEIYMRSTPMILQASDIDDVIRNSKFSRRASREIPVFHKLLEDCAEYPLGRDKSYEMLSQFIHTAKMEEGISKEREISFFIKQKMDDDMTEEDEEA